ncbi:MAG: TatD family hydrolase [Halomonas sp. BM-2019]|nr:MAG: TatD family hydrolase [Halomonas sp. BM-2019]
MMDFHCHLDLYPNARAIHAEAASRNAFTWLVTTSPKAFIATSRVLGTSSTVLITPGLHPEIAHERSGELDLLLSQFESAPAVGEVGLDGSPRFRHSYAVQCHIFGAVVERCRELGGRTLSIHSRRAVKDVLTELGRNPGFGTAVLHWFTGSTTELKAAIDLGCWFSIGPAAFNSAHGKSLAKSLPKDRVVPESDGPFARVDGKPVMPWSLAKTAHLLAGAWEVSPSEAIILLEINSNRLLQVMGFPSELT